MSLKGMFLFSMVAMSKILGGQAQIGFPHNFRPNVPDPINTQLPQAEACLDHGLPYACLESAMKVLSPGFQADRFSFGYDWKFKEAKKYLEAYVRNFARKDISQGYAYLALAKIYEQENDDDRKRDAYNKALEISPSLEKYGNTRHGWLGYTVQEMVQLAQNPSLLYPNEPLPNLHRRPRNP